MSETVTRTVFCPISGEEYTVEMAEEDYAEDVVDCGEGYDGNGLQVIFRDPSDSADTWFEVLWALERVDGNETEIESDGTVALYCPRCGDQITAEFKQHEFEHLNNPCSSCGSVVHFIRDQPTESGQSHVVNYEYHIYE